VLIKKGDSITLIAIIRQIKQAGFQPARRICKDKILRGELLIRTVNFYTRY
jgi:hypothetical protein